MILQYQPVEPLPIVHTKGIVRAAFSCDGTYLATAGLDGRVCVWNVTERELLCCFKGASPVLSIQWPTKDENKLLCGSQDGYIATYIISGQYIEVRGFLAHSNPVECLALNDDRLACGAGPDLSVWKWNDDESTYVREVDIEDPPKSSYNEAKEVLVTSIHWISSAQYPSALAVTYMNHGIVLFNTDNWARTRTFSLNGLIASADVSPDGTRIAVSNAIRGFDVYSLASGDPLCTVDHEIRHGVPTPAIWIHGGLALLGGSTAGQLTLWDVLHIQDAGNEDRQPTNANVLYRLPVPLQEEVVAIAAHYDAEKDVFFIAAGAINVDAPSACYVWKAEEHTQRAQSGAERVAQPGTRVVPGMACSVYFSWTISLICVAALAYTWSAMPHDEL